MSDSITLSPKHGVNPSVAKCFWCGKDKGVALFGKMRREDKEAPHYVISDYDPCDECEKIFDQGILIIGASKDPVIEDMPPIGTDANGAKLYPTGAHVVVKEEFARYLFRDAPEEELNSIFDIRKVVMPSDAVIQFIDMLEKAEEENK